MKYIVWISLVLNILGLLVSLDRFFEGNFPIYRKPTTIQSNTCELLFEICWITGCVCALWL